MKRNMLIIQILMLIPFGAALVFLASPIFDIPFSMLISFAMALPFLVLPVYNGHPVLIEMLTRLVRYNLSFTLLLLLVLTPLLLVVASLVATQHAGPLRRLAALSPCWLAPLAIFNAWTLTPGIPYSSGGYGYFLHWLTKYPNFGPINIEVLLGIVCVSLSALLPAIFASYVITQSPRRLVVLALVLVELLCLGAVMINLDYALLLVGLTIVEPTLFMGPLLRLAAATAMGAAAYGVCLRTIEHPTAT